MEYLKLGENASIFFDPSTHLLIRGKEIIAIEKAPKSKKYGLARRNGHVSAATEEEYQAYLDSLSPDTQAKVTEKEPVKQTKKGKEKAEVDEYDYNPDLLTLTPDEFRERVKQEGFLDEDIDKFKKMTDIKKMIRLFDEVNKSYIN